MLIDEYLPAANFVRHVSVEVDADPEHLWEVLPDLPALFASSRAADWLLQLAARMRRDRGSGVGAPARSELREGAGVPIPERYGTTPATVVALDEGREVVCEGSHRFAKFFSNVYLERLPHGRTRVVNVTRANFRKTFTGRVYLLGVRVLHTPLVRIALRRFKEASESHSKR